MRKKRQFMNKFCKTTTSIPIAPTWQRWSPQYRVQHDRWYCFALNCCLQILSVLLSRKRRKRLCSSAVLLNAQPYRASKEILCSCSELMLCHQNSLVNVWQRFAFRRSSPSCEHKSQRKKYHKISTHRHTFITYRSHTIAVVFVSVSTFE